MALPSSAYEPRDPTSTWDHELCRAVTGVALRTVLGFLRRRARGEGIAGGRSGAVTIVQRFGGALNLNVHLHALVLDGVFTVDGNWSTFIPCGGSRARTWRASWR